MIEGSWMQKKGSTIASAFIRQLEQRMAKVKMGLSSIATKLELIAFDDLWPTAQMQLVLKSPLSHLVSDSKFV